MFSSFHLCWRVVVSSHCGSNHWCLLLLVPTVDHPGCRPECPLECRLVWLVECRREDHRGELTVRYTFTSTVHSELSCLLCPPTFHRVNIGLCRCVIDAQRSTPWNDAGKRCVVCAVGMATPVVAGGVVVVVVGGVGDGCRVSHCSRVVSHCFCFLLCAPYGQAHRLE
jgi:hypothetical protein